MQLDLETVLTVMAESYHFNFTVVKPPFAGLENFDSGLRRILDPGFDFPEFGRQLLEKTPFNTFITTRDELNCLYLLFRLPEQEQKLYLFGPVVRNVLTDGLARQVIGQYGEDTLGRLAALYQGIHISHTSDGRNFLHALHAAAFPETKLRNAILPGFLPMSLLAPPQEPAQDPLFDQGDPALLHKAFHLETQLMSAVASGDSKQALDILSQLSQYLSPQVRGESSLNLKEQALELNAICKYVVAETQKVHPSYIMHIHKAYLSRIGSVSNIRDATRLIGQMVADYCDCVSDHALDHYSPLIRRVLDHIHLNLDSPLSLRSLALLCNVNPSYLSKLFRSETGMTLTEYINHYRIQRSIPLLRCTEMSIAQISETVGFLDENYYARVFKRVMGQPPKTYRQQNKT